MADFVAVLRKTLGGLENPTPEMRQKVYSKARTTISAKLAALDPAPPQSVIDRQKAMLEKAIVDVEASYGSAEAEAEVDPLEDFISGAAFGTAPGSAPAPKPVEPPSVAASEAAPAKAEPAEPVLAGSNAASGNNSETAEAAQTELESSSLAGSQVKNTRFAGVITAAIVVLLVVGAGYAIWKNKDDLSFALTSLFADDTDTADDGDPAAMDTTEDTATGGQAVTDNGDQPAADNATGSDAQPTADEEENPKFTQRLMEDGTEVDDGPAASEPTIGEGTSVAAATVSPADAGSETAPADNATETGAEAPESTALPIGQRAIFYEERTSSLQGSAQAGEVVWSVVQESPGGNLPPEPAIRAEATIPDKNIQFNMTIRRNGDDTLPASHIIEMIFITPENFDGGGIENVLRITFKDSEQSAGNPLLGIPAKISDGFFLLALTDSEADIEANTRMMGRLEWLDVPLVYSSGRRALITMEKGVPGSRVFDEVLKSWTEASSG